MAVSTEMLAEHRGALARLRGQKQPTTSVSTLDAAEAALASLGVFLAHAAAGSNQATYRPFKGPIKLQNNSLNHHHTFKLPQGRVWLTLWLIGSKGWRL